MSGPWLTIRVFISSTFHDMQAERDFLVRFVFPELRQDLLRYRLHLVEVDLRWGVTSEPLETCRAVVDECRPRFLCLLGGRYGTISSEANRSITEDEIHFGVLDHPPIQHGHAFFYFREPQVTRQIPEDARGRYLDADGSESARRLAALKQRIVAAGLPVTSYTAVWDDTWQRLTRFEVFGKQVRNDLLASLQIDPALADRFSDAASEESDEFAEEERQMAAFVAERSQPEGYVVGDREPILQEALAFAEGESAAGTFVVTGQPGTGKSAFLARLTQALASRIPALHVLPHFVGASRGSTSLRNALRRLCHRLSELAGRAEPVPDDPHELRAHFKKLVRQVSPTRRVVIVIDALDEVDLAHGGQLLGWLPDTLPAGVRLIVSTANASGEQPEPELLGLLRSRMDSRLVELAPLSEMDAMAVVENRLRRHAKRFQPAQCAALLGKPAGRLPLYLFVAVEELRTLGHHREIGSRIDSLPGSECELFGWILTERLAFDPGFRDHDGRPHGKALVEKFSASLAVSRHGLSQAEFVALLEPGDPLGNVAALLRLLRPYLMFRGDLLDFRHRVFREAAERTYLTTAAHRRSAHLAVAECLRSFADPVGDLCCRGATAHALSELPHHLGGAEEWSELAATLENVFFLQAKSANGMVYELIDDFVEAARVLPPEEWTRAGLGLIENALRRDVHFIARHAKTRPLVVLQCFWNQSRWIAGSLPLRMDDSAAEEHQFLEWRFADRLDRHLSAPLSGNAHPWLRVVGPHSHRTGCAPLATISGHSRGVVSVAVSHDGRHLATCGGYDHTLRIWGVQNGLEVLRIEVGLEYARCVAFAPDGTRIAGGSDGNLRVWELPTGRELVRRKTQIGHVEKLVFTADSRFLVIQGFFQLQVWETGSWAWVRSLGREDQDYRCFALNSDGTLLAAAGELAGITVWRISDWECVKSFATRASLGDRIAISTDGRWIATAYSSEYISGEAIVRVWETGSGAEIYALRGHAREVHELVFLPNEPLLLTASMDGTMRLWNVVSGTEVATACDQIAGIHCLALFPAGGRCVSGSWNGLAHLWEIDRMKSNAVASLQPPVRSIAYSPNGDFTVSARWGDPAIEVWDSRSGLQIRSLINEKTDESSWVATAAVVSMAFVSGSTLLVVGGSDGSVQFWDVATGGLKQYWGWPGTQRVECLAVSADGRFVAAASGYQVACWENGGERRIYALPHEVERGESLAFSPDGRLVAVRAGGRILVWDLASGREIARFLGFQFAFSPDGTHLAFKSSDHGIHLVTLAKMEIRQVFHGQQFFGADIAFSRDGTRLASGPRGYPHHPGARVTKVWDVATGALKEEIRGWGVDLAAIAEGPARFPYRLVSRDGEAVVEQAAENVPVASFPKSLVFTATHPDGRQWAARCDSGLLFIRLEHR